MTYSYWVGDILENGHQVEPNKISDCHLDVFLAAENTPKISWQVACFLQKVPCIACTLCCIADLIHV